MKTIPRDRLALVEKLFLEGATERAIQAEASKKFGVTRRAVRRYIQRVRASLAAQVKATDPDAMRALVQELLLNAYRTAAAGGAETGPNAGAMVNAAARLGELHGVMAPKRIEHSGAIGTDPDALLRRVQDAAAPGGGAADPGAAPGAEPRGPGGDRRGGR